MINWHWMRGISFVGCVICVLLGPYAIAQEQPQADKAVSHQTNSKIPTTEEVEAAFWAVFKPGPDAYRAICEKPKSREYADLCQQWKAAEAAKESARWAFPQFIVSIVGIFGLLWTIFYTHRTYNLAATTSQAELRAYISMKPTDLINLGGEDFLQIKFDARNHGQTPAFAVNHKFGISILEVDAVKNGAPIALVKSLDDEVAIYPNSEINTWFNADFKITTEMAREIKSGKSRIYIAGLTSYRDAFDREHVTQFSASAGADFFANYRDQKIPCNWQYQRNHNSAT